MELLDPRFNDINLEKWNYSRCKHRLPNGASTNSIEKLHKYLSKKGEGFAKLSHDFYEDKFFE